MSGACSALCGAMSYAWTVLYPAPSLVISQTISPLSSSSSAELFAPIWNALAPFSPFTRTTCCAAGCITGGWYCGAMPYGLIKGLL